MEIPIDSLAMGRAIILEFAPFTFEFHMVGDVSHTTMTMAKVINAVTTFGEGPSPGSDAVRQRKEAGTDSHFSFFLFVF